MDIFKETSIFAISKIANSKSFSKKLLWASLLLVLASVCSYFLFKVITNYFEYEVVTNVNVYEDKPQFPAVSFCVSSKGNNLDYLNRTLSLKFNFEDCEFDELDYYYNHINERCFRFNTGKNHKNEPVPIKNVSFTNPTSGLMATLYLKDFYEDVFTNKTLPYKLTIMISNQSSVFRRDKMIISNDLILNSGLTYIKIDRQYIERLPSPYSDCVKHDTKEYVSHLFQYFKKNNKIYSREDCKDFCVEEQVKKACNCRGDLGNTTSCVKDENTLRCIIDALSKQNSEIQREKCDKYCPKECDSMTYEIDQNYLGVAPKQFLKIYNLTKEYNDDTYLIFIYYSDLNYVHLKELIKYCPFDLFSQIGGLLGLFIGIGLLSMVEIIDLFFHFSIKIFQHGSSKIRDFNREDAVKPR